MDTAFPTGCQAAVSSGRSRSGGWHDSPVTDLRAIQVVAHRGASEDAPEHTLAAYRKAIDDGADALECDVRLTADGTLVCVHDRRVNRTSNGRGAVSALELADLRTLDFGSWKAEPGTGRAAGTRRRPSAELRSSSTRTPRPPTASTATRTSSAAS